MPGQAAHQAEPIRHAGELPDRYWTRLEERRAPGGPGRVDLVLVGPSGVHVVIDQPPDVAADLVATAWRASAAGAAVADLLPARYRAAVAAEVRLLGTDGVAAEITVEPRTGAVCAASPDLLDQVWRCRPRVLSTSEAAVVAGVLRERLLPDPVDRRSGLGPWWRRRRVLVAAGLVTAAAGAAAAVTVGDVMPWVLP